MRAMASLRLFRCDYSRQYFLENINTSKGWDPFCGDNGWLEIDDIAGLNPGQNDSH